MERKRESITLTYPHDLYRRLKEDEYLPLDERVAKVQKTYEERFVSSQKGYIRFPILKFRFNISWILLGSMTKKRRKEILLKTK